MAFDGYRGNKGGAVQTAYTDQPGQAMPGMLAFASDINLTDALYVGETLGLLSGVGIKLSNVSDDISLQRPNLSALLPTAGMAAADFGGILVFDEHMQSDENGNPGYELGRIGRFLRPIRAGGRVYVKVKATVDHTTDDVYWIFTAGTTFALGDFAPAMEGTVVQAGASVAGSGNTGNGVMGAITADGAAVGAHKLVCIEPATDAGAFALYDPNGVFLDTVTVASAYDANGLAFTLADGSADFVAGDYFTITVTESGAEAVMLPNVRWVTSADADEFAILEFLG